MKLYLSGHLHVYERTAPICFNGSYMKSDSGEYNMSCPIYVIEGVGGSDQYLQMNEECICVFIKIPKNNLANH